MPQSGSATTDLDLIGYLKAIPDARMRRGVRFPAWYLLFARLAVVDVRVLSVPRRADGPDLAVLEQLAREHRPRLVILNTVVHNPTGFSLSPAVAHGILTLAQTWDFHIIEDDTYSELHANPACRLAQLDQLNRVTVVGGYSKVMAAGLRVAIVQGRLRKPKHVPC